MRGTCERRFRRRPARPRASHAVADEAVGLAQDCSLHAVEHEALDLGADVDDAHACAPEQVARTVDDDRTCEGCRDQLDHREEVRRVARVRDEAAAAAGEVLPRTTNTALHVRRVAKRGRELWRRGDPCGHVAGSSARRSKRARSSSFGRISHSAVSSRPGSTS
jgi:hypothetical protein